MNMHMEQMGSTRFATLVWIMKFRRDIDTRERKWYPCRRIAWLGGKPYGFCIWLDVSIFNKLLHPATDYYNLLQIHPGKHNLLIREASVYLVLADQRKFTYFGVILQTWLNYHTACANSCLIFLSCTECMRYCGEWLGIRRIYDVFECIIRWNCSNASVVLISLKQRALLCKCWCWSQWISCQHGLVCSRKCFSWRMA